MGNTEVVLGLHHWLASFQNFVLHMSVARKTTICGGGGGGGVHPFISAIISDKVSFSVSI